MKKSFKIILVAAILIFWGSVTAQGGQLCNKPAPTAEGPVIGIDGDAPGTCAYKGVPYAAPPTGSLRWRPPEAAIKRAGVLEAKSFGARCMQPDTSIFDQEAERPKTGEDCLFLNIWRPAKEGKFPVMVWIHGGAFVMGAGSEPLYRADKLAAGQDVVVVTINYRLGPFGFLAIPGLRAEDPHKSAGNYGILDQTAALKWVHENIASFGGNPDNVTMFGQSAGGFSVCSQMASPLSAGLFHRAVMESGSCRMIQTMDEGRKVGTEFAAKAGCKDADIVKCMRSKPAEELITAAFPMDGGATTMMKTMFAWWPRVDGWSIPEEPIESLKSGKFNQTPFMVGYTADEMKLFLSFMPKWMLKTPRCLLKSFVKKVFGKAEKNMLVEYYPLKKYPKPFFAVMAYLGDMVFGCSAFEAAMAVSKYQPTYLYRFDYDDHSQPVMLGAAHSFEIPFIYDSFDGSFKKIYTDEQVKKAKPLVSATMNYWGNFAKNKDPNGTGTVNWPPFTQDKKTIMILDLPLRTEPAEICEICNIHERLGTSFVDVMRKSF